MDAHASAFAALGLEPGADQAAVERAYRDLIKRYHPDRSGGDSGRAAEINRAYFELRARHRAGGTGAGPIAAARPRRDYGERARRQGRRGWPWPVLLLVPAIVLVAERERVAAEVPRWVAALHDLPAKPLPGGRASAVALDSAALDGLLDERAIARSIAQAVALAGRGDEEALAAGSRECHRRLRAEPDLEQLDRCAAFDDAVAAIADRDPLHDSGTFNASAITARQMNAASLLSSDYLAIERRLDRIRMVVQLTLRPAPPPVREMPVETEAAPEVEREAVPEIVTEEL